MAANAQVLAWVREMLTGDDSSALISDSRVERWQAGAVTDLSRRYPCIGDDPLTDLTSTDLASFQEAAGALIAARIAASPGGQDFAKFIVRQKQGAVELAYASSDATAKSAADVLNVAMQRAMGRIDCVRTARAAANTGSPFGKAGRRDSIGEDATVQGRLLGRDEDGELS